MTDRMRLSTVSLGTLAVLASAGAIAQSQPKQVVKPPISQAWIDVATFSGFAMGAGMGQGMMGGQGQGMQFMDDAIWRVMQQGIVTPHEAYMKAIDKNRFRVFLPPEDEGL